MCGAEIDATLFETVVEKLKVLTDPKDLKRVAGNIDVLANVDVM